MNLITDSIAIGNHVDARDGELLARHGVTGVLCLARDRLAFPPPGGIERDGWPLEDGAGNAVSDLHGALRKLDRLLERHKVVLVHCHAGKSRSCGLVALWVARREAISLDDAIARVAAKRPELWIAPDLRETLERALA